MLVVEDVVDGVVELLLLLEVQVVEAQELLHLFQDNQELLILAVVEEDVMVKVIEMVGLADLEL
jgi:hypothetical protein